MQGEPGESATGNEDASERASHMAELLDALLAASPVGVALFDRELRWTRVNEAFATISGLQVEEMLGHTPSELLGELGRRGERALRKVLETGQPEQAVEVSGELPAGSGQRRRLLVNRFPIRAPSGEVLGVGSLVTDVTEQVRTEAQLRESEERFRLTVENAPIGMALVGTNGQFLEVNRTFSELLGYSAEELMRRRFQDVTHPEDVELDEGLARKLLVGEIPRYQLEKRYIRKDGAIVDVLLHASLVRNARGRPVHYIAQVKDITESRRAERERERLHTQVEQERQWLNTVLDRSPVGIILVQRAGEEIRLRANQRAEALMGHPISPEGGTQQYAGQVCDVAGRALPAEELPSARALRGESIAGEEFIIRRPDGSQTPVLGYSAPLRDATGRIMGGVGIFQDISALKEMERLREEWTSVVAHDLRQPLGVISYATHLAQKARGEQTAAKQALELERIRGATRQLERMVEDLLDVSRIEARRLQLQRTQVDLTALARESVERLTWLTEGYEVRVESRGSREPVWADPGRIEQVLGNLLSNAAKYGERGTEIRIEVEGRETEVEVTVTNQGRGIPEAELKRLFHRFSRSADTRKSDIPGLGLGLYICKGLIEVHGGRIWAESTPGRLTRFHFTLPRTPGGERHARHT